MQKAESDQEKLGKLKTARDDLAKLDRQTKEQEDRKARLAQAEQAQKVLPHYDAYEWEVTAADDKREELRKAQTELKKAATKRKVAAGLLEREQARDNERKQARSELDRLQQLGEKVEAITTATSQRAEAQIAVSEIKVGLKGKADALADLENELTVKRKELVTAEKLKAELGGRRSQRQELSRAAIARGKLEKMERQEKTDRKSLHGRRKDVDRLQRLVERYETNLSQIEAAWAAGQAARLAKDLEEGAPCPVCGSTHHPAPAERIDEIPEDSAVASARRELSEAQEVLGDKREQLAKAKAEFANLEERIADLRRELGNLAAVKPSELSRRRAEADKAVEEAEVAARSLTGLKTAINKLEKQKVKAEKAREAVRAQLEKSKRELEGAKATLAEREKSVPKGLRNQAALDKTIATAQRRFDKLEDALKKAKTAFEVATNDHTAAATEEKGSRRALRDAEKRRDTAKVRYEKALAKAEFADSDSFLAARLDEEELRTLDTKVEEFQQAYRSAQIRLKDAEGEAKGVETPNIEALKVALDKAEEAHTKAHERAIELRRDLQETKQWLEELSELRKNFADLDRRHRLEGLIADVATGDNPRRLSFERYVLAALLDEVIAAANQRLGLMSGHRYLLRRHEDVEDRRQLAGLNLDVLDSYTDKPRPVSTLSGGEGFLAALCLALGVADVVQAYSGGTALETLFIDEGFGNLSSDALDAAIQTLIQLQSEGRLVGIISHVSELRDRLDARLEVTSTMSGSSARFVAA
jgi:exonuclease SbcC